MNDSPPLTPTPPNIVRPGFEEVAAAFFATVPNGRHSGAAVSVWVDGEEAVRLASGTADPSTGAPFTDQTLVPLASVTKGLASLLVARLVARGDLPSYETPIAEIWPEFGAHGKGQVSIGDVLAHRAGVSAPRRGLTDDEIWDPLAMADVLAEQEPLWSPGRGHQYHAVTHGAITAKLVSVATGRTLGAVLADEVARPLGAEAWVGLPAGQDARVVTIPIPPAPTPPPGSEWIERALDLGAGKDILALVQTDQGRRAELPGANGIGTASAVAKIWSAAVVETNGVRLIDEQTAALLRAPRSTGAPVFADPPPYQHFGAGVMIPSNWEWYLTNESFGHDGAHGQVAFADPYYKVGFAYLTSLSGDWVRGQSVVNALGRALS
ncbi:serine hydrolase domain-containing protein [Nocardioides sp. WG-D5]